MHLVRLAAWVDVYQKDSGSDYCTDHLISGYVMYAVGGAQSARKLAEKVYNLPSAGLGNCQSKSPTHVQAEKVRSGCVLPGFSLQLCPCASVGRL